MLNAPQMTAARLPRSRQWREKQIKLGGSFSVAGWIALPIRSRWQRADDGATAGRILKALARGWRWQRMLDERIYTSVSEISEAEAISKSYVRCGSLIAAHDAR